MVDFDIAQFFLVIFAALGVGFSIFEAIMRWREQNPRVRVSIYISRVPDRDESSRVTSEEEFYEMWNRLPDYVFIRAQNIGNKSVTLLSSMLKLSGPMTYAPDPSLPGSKWQSDVSFPHELMPAKSCRVFAPVEDVKHYLMIEGQEGKIAIRASYRDAVGNEYYSKKTWSERVRRTHKEGPQITITLPEHAKPK